MPKHIEKRCPCYSNIGACRNGDRCFGPHNPPSLSRTILLSNMYQRLDMITPGVDAQGQPIDPRKIQEHFEDFYEDIFEELIKFGEIDCLHVCDNLADHMVGNVYVMFKYEEVAAAALQAFRRRAYCGRKIIVDFSPVTDFRQAVCKRFEEKGCDRGIFCNFIHVKQIGRSMRRRLFGKHHSESRESRSQSRSVSPFHRTRSEGRGGDYCDRANGRPSADRHSGYDGIRRRHRNWRPRRTRSPVREGSRERREKIERWNRERERDREGRR